MNKLLPCIHPSDTMPHFCIPAGSEFTSGLEFQNASNSISPSPRLSLPSRLPCPGLRSGDRSDAGMGTCGGSVAGIVLALPPVSGPDPPGTTEVKLLRLVWSEDISSVPVQLLRKLRIGSSDLLII